MVGFYFLEPLMSALGWIGHNIVEYKVSEITEIFPCHPIIDNTRIHKIMGYKIWIDISLVAVLLVVLLI